MKKQYLSQLKEESVWHMMQHYGRRDVLSYCVEEAGRFVLEGTSPIHCGRDAFIVIYSQSGGGVLVSGDKRLALPSGSIALIDCSQPYALRKTTHSPADWVFSWVRFNGDTCRPFYESLNSERPTVYTVEDVLQADTEFAAILELFEQLDPYSFIKLSHSISTLLNIMVGLKSNRRSQHKEMVSSVARYIRDNYNEPLDIDRLSKKAKLSKFYFIKLFKEYISTAPYEYVIAHRINEAKKYLRTTWMKVSQISSIVGFNDECNFIRTFKRFTGLTPLQYRERQR